MAAGLLAFFLLYFAVAFVLPTVRVRQRTGVNPLVLRRDDNAHGIVGRWFGAVLIAVLVMLFALTTGLPADRLGRLAWVETDAARVAGAVLLIGSLLLVAVAQAQMGRSWRIGIDFGGQPPLVRSGLFARTRNPIFLGMRAALFGLFLTLPNAATLAVLLLGEALMQIQVRLEEQHLATVIGAEYEQYRASVPRWW